MHTKDLTNDAKAILLLCGRFGKEDEAKPLSLKEYNRLTDWMLDKKIRPADLLAAGSASILEPLPQDIDAQRIKRLLGRGAALALAIDKWTANGLWVICRSDEKYPVRLKRHLKKQAPPMLYGVGDFRLLDRGGLAVVGSRNVDPAGEAFTGLAAAACAKQGIPIVSGGARGVDQTAMLEGLSAGGAVVGVLADSLLKSAVAKKYRDGIREQRLVLVSAFSPEARFNVGNAMGRNKQIYALADFALVISAEKGKGGTWTGAVEELKREQPRPVFVRQGANVPQGNMALMDLGAQPFPEQPWDTNLAARLAIQPANRKKPPGVQQSLFEGPAKSPATTAAVREDAKDYRPEMTETIEASSQTVSGEIAENPVSVFEAVLPLLMACLKDWQTPKDLAERLGVRKTQLEDWLKQAMEEGRIQKKNRPVRYRKS